jgi:hypothetical protein
VHELTAQVGALEGAIDELFRMTGGRAESQGKQQSRAQAAPKASSGPTRSNKIPLPESSEATLSRGRSRAQTSKAMKDVEVAMRQ